MTGALATRLSCNTDMMHLLRCLFFIEARFEFGLSCVHLPGAENGQADALSRNDMASFRSKVPAADQEPQPIPTQLVKTLLAPVRTGSQQLGGVCSLLLARPGRVDTLHVCFWYEMLPRFLHKILDQQPISSL